MAVAELPPRLTYPVEAVRSDYELEGAVGCELVREFGEVLRQWQNRPSFSFESEESLDTINHVPFTKMGTIKVRFKKARPMNPRVISVEEFD